MNPTPLLEHTVPLRNRPPIGDNALLWKELCFEREVGALRPTPADVYATGTAAAFLALYSFLILFVPSGNGLVELRIIFRFGFTALFCLLLIVVTMQAANSIGRERQQQTLETLFMLPVERSEILRAKLLGCFASPYVIWFLMGIGLVVATATGIIHILATLLLLCSLAVFTLLAACIGLWCSTVSRTQLQANLRAVLGVILLNALFYLLAVNTTGLMRRWIDYSTSETIQRVLIYGFTPTVAINVLSFSYGDFLDPSGFSSALNFNAALAGLVFYAVLTWFLWRAIVHHFRPESDSWWTRYRARKMVRERRRE